MRIKENLLWDFFIDILGVKVPVKKEDRYITIDINGSLYAYEAKPFYSHTGRVFVPVSEYFYRVMEVELTEKEIANPEELIFVVHKAVPAIHTIN